MKLDVYDKYDGRIIDSIEADTQDSIHEKIKQIGKFEKKLLGLSLDDRINTIKSFSTILKKKKKELIDLMVAEVGLPVKYADLEFQVIEDFFKGIDWFRDFIEDRNLKELEADRTSQLMFQPIGSTAVFTPRNTPISLPLYFLGSSFMTSNPALIKPSITCPLSLIKCMNLLKQTDFQFNDAYDLIFAPGNSVIDLLIESDIIKSLVFVASSHTAKDILLRYAKVLKKSIKKFMGIGIYTSPFKQFYFECAGNDAGIIMPGVNLKKVAKWNAIASFTNAGQQAFSLKRIIIHKDIYDDYIALFLNEIEKLKMGDPKDPSTDIGPLGSRAILMMMETMIADVKKYKGVEILTGAKKIDTGEDYGLFYKPTLVQIPIDNLVDFNKAPFLWREEAFGPVRCVIMVKDIDEAISLANQSNYGMRAVVYTPLNYISRFKTELMAGSIYINAEPMQLNFNFPLGGWKDSSYPPGIKYYPIQMVQTKFIHQGSIESQKTLLS